MDLFDTLNWRLTKILLSSFGCWPFQSRTQKIIFGALGIFMLDSIFIPEIIKLIIDRNNLRLIIDYIPLIILHIIVQMKIFSSHKNIETVKKLLLHVKRDWEVNSSESELIILRNGSINLKAFTDTYAVCLFTTGYLYATSPLVPKVLDYFVPLNESRPDLPIYYTEFFIDSNKYSTVIYIFSWLVTSINPIVFVAFDTMYAGLIQHSCCMFLIIGKRIKNLSYDLNNKEINNSQNDNTKVDDFKSLVKLMEMHKQLLEFVDLVANNYSGILLVLLGTIVLGMSFTGFQAIAAENKLEDKIRFIVFGLSQVVHLFMLSHFGQQLIDHSEYIYKAASASQWYNFTNKSKLLIVLMMVRCNVVSTITAGGLFVINSRNFIAIMKTSMSYFTMLISVQ